MDWKEREEFRYRRLRFSKCTAVQVERRARELYAAWVALRIERKRLRRDQAEWYGSLPRPVDPFKPFCFVLGRMKRAWREADRLADTSGTAVDATIGSTDARRQWFGLVARVSARGELIRIRHRSYDEPVILVAESRFRDIERRARDRRTEVEVEVEPQASAATLPQRRRSPPFW